MSKTKNRSGKRRRHILATFTLSFGRYSGKRLGDVPRDYLLWAVKEADGVPDADSWAIRQFLSIT